tara:strand:+ start:953 stop:1780 length:828 start_codon:yes stop_codon:yes gene_type:complete
MKEPEYDIGYCYEGAVSPAFYRQTQYSGVSYVSWYIREGEVSVMTDGHKLQAKAGDWVFIDPLTMKTHAFTENARIISLRFSINWSGLHYFPPLNAPWLYNGPESAHMVRPAAELCRLIRQAALQRTPLTPTQYAERGIYFSQWVHRWHRIREERSWPLQLPTDMRVSELILCLMKSISIAPVNYDALTATVGLSKAQINRIFKDSTGQTPKQWKEAACLKSSENLLNQNKLSIKEIAAELGFTDPSHFSKWFRKHMKHSPLKWRSMQLGYGDRV